jgi:hypothetical protein
MFVLCTARQAFAEPEPVKLSQAKELFRQGVTLLSAGDTERALEHFLRSRELLPSGKNTVNAAICLERLGRYDEALELYEEVVLRFARDLDEQDRTNLTPVMQSLRAKIGYLELSANVEGLVTIAGRPRGRLPLRTALRVLPGSSMLRITQDGYRPFESELLIHAGETQRLDARLEPMPAPAAPLQGLRSPAASPRRPQRASAWNFDVNVRGGALYAPFSRAGLESSCPALCAGNRSLWGAQGAVAFGVRYRNGWGLELGAGYWSTEQSLNRAVLDGYSDSGATAVVTYALEQTLAGRGPFGLLQGRFERPLPWGMMFSSRAGAGLWLARFETEVTGQAWTRGPAEPLRASSKPVATETAPFVAMSLGVGRRLGRFTLSLDLGILYLPMPGPALGGPVLGASGDCPASQPRSVGCSPNSHRLEQERAHGSFFMLTPQLGARYTF